jgi:chromosome partitioning protein
MIIAIANQKGGVGKTTTTICLGGLLAEKHRCLAVDLDPQGNLTVGLGVEVSDGQLSAYDVMTEQASAEEAIVTTDSGLDLLPADITLAKGETEILTRVGNFLILRERLESIATRYRFILIDCPPSLGLLTLNGLSAADAVLVPVQCQFFALKGLAALLETIDSVRRRLNPNLQVLGVLPTMAEPNTIMTQDVLASLRKRLKDVPVFDPVLKSVKFPESNLAGQPIHQYAGYSKLVAPYQAIAQRLHRSIATQLAGE